MDLAVVEQIVYQLSYCFLVTDRMRTSQTIIFLHLNDIGFRPTPIGLIWPQD